MQNLKKKSSVCGKKENDSSESSGKRNSTSRFVNMLHGLVQVFRYIRLFRMNASARSKSSNDKSNKKKQQNDESSNEDDLNDEDLNEVSRHKNLSVVGKKETFEKSFSKLKNKSPKSHYDEEDFLDAFSYFDTNGDGRITHSELARVLKKLEINLPKKEVKKMIHALDKDGNGTIEYSEVFSFNYLRDKEIKLLKFNFFSFFFL
jgi:Ca2+-binding EF-hand superfamily protein